ANKARAALTILGVAIGVVAVVVMSAAIHGINSGIAREFERAGPSTFFLHRFPITLGPCFEGAESCPWRNNPPIRLTEVRTLSRLESIQDVAAGTQTGARIRYRDRTLNSLVRAYTANWI